MTVAIRLDSLRLLGLQRQPLLKSRGKGSKLSKPLSSVILLNLDVVMGRQEEQSQHPLEQFLGSLLEGFCRKYFTKTKRIYWLPALRSEGIEPFCRSFLIALRSFQLPFPDHRHHFNAS